MRKAKAQLELNLVRNVKSKVVFCKYINSKRKTIEVGPLVKRTLAMVTWATEKAEVLNAFLGSVFSGITGL